MHDIFADWRKKIIPMSGSMTHWTTSFLSHPPSLMLGSMRGCHRRKWQRAWKHLSNLCHPWKADAATPH